MVPPSLNKNLASPNPPISNVEIDIGSPVAGFIALSANSKILFLFIE